MDETCSLRSRHADPRHTCAVLHRRLAARVYVWCQLRLPRSLWPRLDPDDLAQEIWLRALAAIERRRPGVADLGGLVFGIAARTLAEQLRRHCVRRRERAGRDAETALAATPDPANVVAALVRSEQLQRLCSLAEGLPAVDRFLLLQRGLEGRTHGAVARQLGVTVAAVEMRWHRLLLRLRRACEKAGLGRSG